MELSQSGKKDDSSRRGFSAEGTRYGIVVARYNAQVTEEILQRSLQVIRSHSVLESDVTVVYVPGSLEIPVALQALAEKASYDSLLAIGCILKGETHHFDLVTTECYRGIMDVSLSYGVPIANGVLAINNLEQAHNRLNIGSEIAYVAMDMAFLFRDMGK